jgi:DNA-binding NarL/FixJ family response regulator
MSFDHNNRRFSLLLVEPYTLVRSTVASVARGLDMVDIQETPSVDAAESLLRARAFDGFVIALGEDRSGIELVTRIRNGSTSSPSKAAVAITTDQVDQDSIEKLRQLEVKRVLLKPFKVKTVLETISAFAQPATPRP